VFPSEQLAGLRYDPESQSGQVPDAVEGGESTDASRKSALLGNAVHSGRPMTSIAELADPRKLMDAITAFKQVPESGASAIEAPPATTLEGTLLRIWRSALDGRALGIHDNFFDAGGTSLKAVQVVALIRKELGRGISIVTLFECPTVDLLARRLGASPGVEPRPAEASEAQHRGQQRRQRILKRKAR
jgi:hypothetical protein